MHEGGVPSLGHVDAYHLVRQGVRGGDLDGGHVLQLLVVLGDRPEDAVRGARPRGGDLRHAWQEAAPQGVQLAGEVVLLGVDTEAAGSYADHASCRLHVNGGFERDPAVEVQQVLVVEADFAQERDLLMTLAIARGRDGERLLEGTGEGLLRFESGGERNLEDAFASVGELVERVGEAPGAHVGLQGLVGERLEDPLEVPLAHPRVARHVGEVDVRIEARLDVIDAAPNVVQVVHAQVSKKPVIVVSLPSAPYSP